MRFSRSLLLCAYVCAVGWVGAQDLPRVSFETRAMRLDQALRALSASVGKDLKVAPELAGEIVVLRLRDVPGQDALDRLAKAVVAEWDKTGDTWRLTRPSEFMADLRAKDAAAFIVGIKSSLEKDVREPVFSASAPAVEPAEEEDPDESPQDRAARKEYQRLYQQAWQNQTKLWTAVRKSLDPATLAGIAPGGRLVLSTHPSAGQGAVGSAVLSAYQTYATDLNATLAAFEKIGQSGASFAGTGFSRPARMLVAIKRTSPYSWTIHSRLFQPNNRPTGENMIRVSVTSDDALQAMFDEDGPKDTVKAKIKLTKPETKIPAAEVLKPFAMVINSLIQGAPPPMTNMDDLLKFFQTPDVNDPLSLAASTTLLTLAEDQSANLVAVVPDEAFGLEGGQMTNRELTLDTAVGLLENLSASSLTSADGWVTMAPKYASVSHLCRLNRVALRALIDAEKRQGSLSVLDKGRFFLTYPEWSESLWSAYQFLAVPGMMDAMMMGMMGGEPNEAYRFFGLLQESQINTLLVGQAIPYVQLSPQQRTQFDRCIDQITALDRPARNPMDWLTGDAVPPMLEEMDEEGNEKPMPFADISDRPGQAAQTGFIRIAAREETVVKPSAGNTFAFFGAQNYDAATYAMMKQMMSSPESMAFQGMFPKLENMQIGKRLTLDLQFHVYGNHGGRHALSGVTLDQSGKRYNESELPADFLEAVRKATERFNPERPPNSDGTMPDEGDRGGVKP